MKKELDRTLGLFQSLTISIGTMIGSAIFVLAGTSFAIAGASASLSIFLAGLAALFTGFSFAELVTIIPKAGGGYVYVKEGVENKIISFICGWGFWLGYSMSCAVFAIGFGNFLNYFIPVIPTMVGAYLLILYVIFMNIKGTKSSGSLQDKITVGLIVILLVYVVVGIFFIDTSNYTPFFSEQGTAGTFQVMGILYMTYIGYGLITTASEEVIEPEKTIPKAIIISLVFVIFLKTAVFLIGSGIAPWTQLTPDVTSTPLTDTAAIIAGPVGGYIFAFAGLLATLSSINTGVMASSRTAFAMARDNKLPSVFKTIDSKSKTPVIAILFTGIFVTITVSVANVDNISSVTSIFSLIGYSFVNIALMSFRKNRPELKRHFKVPLYPLTPIIGTILNVIMIIQLALTDTLAAVVAIIILLIGIIYFYFGLPKLESAPKGMSNYDIPKINIQNALKQKKERNIYVPMSNPDTMDKLLNFSSVLAMKEEETSIIPIHVSDVPDSIALDDNYTELKSTINNFEGVLEKLKKYEVSNEKNIKPIIVFSRDIAHGILKNIKSGKNNMLLMGWHHTGVFYNKQVSLISKMLMSAPVDVGILKASEKNEYKKILFPYGGGRYSQLSAVIVKRIADAYDAEVTILRVVSELEDGLEENLKDSSKDLGERFNTKVIKGELVKTIVNESENYDLVVMGASLDWGIKEYLTGTRSDDIVEKAKCAVLIVKSYNATLQRKGIRKHLYKVKSKFS